MIDETHDPAASSWVDGGEAHPDFPVQNLPLGIFSTDGASPRAATAVGAFVLDITAALPVLKDQLPPAVIDAVQQPRLNALFGLEPTARRALRLALFRALTDRSRAASLRALLRPASECQLHLPVDVRDFTDFYAGIHHASAVGALLRPENPLLPNYKYIPVGYHGRASSIRASGGEIARPRGQLRPAGADAPALGPSDRLDYEVELGVWIGGRSQLGTPISIDRADDHIAGFSLLNDWSARDIQAWEYQPLGPFLAKNFASTVSPWIVTAEALAPFHCAPPPRPDGDPAPLPYLTGAEDRRSGALDICIEVTLRTELMRANGLEPFRLGRTSSLYLYWTVAQMIAHHTVNGCDLAAGDLIGTGTISGPDDESRGSLMELSQGGRMTIALPSGETRTFLHDGDEISLTGWAERVGYRRIGFGACTARIVAANT